MSTMMKSETPPAETSNSLNNCCRHLKYPVSLTGQPSSWLPARLHRSLASDTFLKIEHYELNYFYVLKSEANKCSWSKPV